MRTVQAEIELDEVRFELMSAIDIAQVVDITVSYLALPDGNVIAAEILKNFSHIFNMLQHIWTEEYRPDKDYLPNVAFGLLQMLEKTLKAIANKKAVFSNYRKEFSYTEYYKAINDLVIGYLRNESDEMFDKLGYITNQSIRNSIASEKNFGILQLLKHSNSRLTSQAWIEAQVLFSRILLLSTMPYVTILLKMPEVAELYKRAFKAPLPSKDVIFEKQFQEVLNELLSIECKVTEWPIVATALPITGSRFIYKICILAAALSTLRDLLGSAPVILPEIIIYKEQKSREIPQDYKLFLEGVKIGEEKTGSFNSIQLMSIQFILLDIVNCLKQYKPYAKEIKKMSAWQRLGHMDTAKKESVFDALIETHGQKILAVTDKQSGLNFLKTFESGLLEQKKLLEEGGKSKKILEETIEDIKQFRICLTPTDPSAVFILTSSNILKKLHEQIIVKAAIEKIRANLEAYEGSHEELLNCEEKNPLLAEACRYINSDQIYALNLIELLINKGHKINSEILSILDKIDHRTLRTAVLPLLSKYKLCDLIKKGNDSKIPPLTYYYLLKIQVPLAWLQAGLIQSAERKDIIYEIINTDLTLENSQYISEVFAFFSDFLDDYQRKHYSILLLEKHAAVKDIRVKMHISAMIAEMASPRKFSVINGDIKSTLEKTFPAVGCSALCWEFLPSGSMLVEEYYQQMQEIITKLSLFPSVLVSLVCDYINQLPSTAIDVIVSGIGSALSKQQEKFFLHRLPVSTQPDLSVCSAYAASNYLLAGLLIQGGEEIVELEITSFFRTASPAREKVTHYFVSQAAESKQGEEDGSPARMWQLFQQAHPFLPLVKKIEKYNQTSPVIIIPVDLEKKGKAKIGHGDAVLQLRMLTGLIKLWVRFSQGNPIAYPFLVYIPGHWLTFLLIAQKEVMQLCLAMDSRTSTQKSLEDIFAPIQELFNSDSALENLSKRVLTEAHQEFKFLKDQEKWTEGGASTQMRALLACWEALAEVKSLWPLVNAQDFKKVESIVEREHKDLISSVENITTKITVLGGRKPVVKQTTAVASLPPVSASPLTSFSAYIPWFIGLPKRLSETVTSKLGDSLYFPG